MTNVWMKDPFKMQDRPMGSHVTEFEKFTDMASNFTLQLTFKETVSFGRLVGSVG